MADVNNKLRLQIITQLDAAGIKATKDQVDSLERGLRNAGKSAGQSGREFSELETAIGNLPGPLGEIGRAMGGLGAKISMVFGAFSIGVELGQKICDTFKEWGWMDDPVNDLIKANKAYNKELAYCKERLSVVLQEELARLEVAEKSHDKILKSIDDQTAAYFRQATALEGLRKHQGNAEMMQLERAKFEEMRELSSAGYTEAAEQVGRYYDVLMAELDAKQKLAEFDRNSVKLAKELTSAEEAREASVQRLATLKTQLKQAEWDKARLIATRGHGIDMYTSDLDVQKSDALDSKIAKLKSAIERTEGVIAKRGEKLENIEADVLSRRLERANLAAAGAFGVDRAAAAYDDYVTSAGNPLNADISENWAKEIARNSAETERTQSEILEVVRRFADRFEEAISGGE